MADGQRNIRTWLVHAARVTKGQALEHQAVQRLAERHPRLLAGLAEGHVLTKSIRPCSWPGGPAGLPGGIPGPGRGDPGRRRPGRCGPAGAGRDLRGDPRPHRPPDPGPDDDPDLDRALSLETTMDGTGVLRGDLTPECAAMVRAVLDALSAPAGGGDLRTRPQRYHDALEEAMRRLLASNLLPKRAGQPVKALVHVSFADLCALDRDSALQEAWITEYRARWAAHRAAASVATGDGGAWLDGDTARRITCDAMIIPVVTADLDPGRARGPDRLVRPLPLHPHPHAPAPPAPTTRQAPTTPRTTPPAPGDPRAVAAALAESRRALSARPRPPGPSRPARPDRRRRPQAREAAAVADMLAHLEHDIIAKILTVVSGPGGVASFLRRQLLGKGLNGPSLPLDVGQTDDIPVHLRRLVDLRDQTCPHPGGCDQPASGCEAHHVTHRKDGGPTSLTNLKDFCWWHHHVLLHELGWQLDRPPGRHQPGHQPQRQNHPQPQPAPSRVAIWTRQFSSRPSRYLQLSRRAPTS